MPSFDDIFEAAKQEQPQADLKALVKAKRGNPDYGNYSVLLPKSLRRRLKLHQATYEDETGEVLEYSELVEKAMSAFDRLAEKNGPAQAVSVHEPYAVIGV